MTKRVLTCGVLLFLVFLVIPRLDARVETTSFLVLIGIAVLLYTLALYFISQNRIGSSRLLLVCLLISVVWRVGFVVEAPLVSDDVYRYVWDGRVQRFGHNPYLSSPDEPALAHLHTDVTQRIDPTSAKLPAIYPPVAELFLRVITMVHESVTAIIIAIVFFDLLIIIILWRWLLLMGKNPWWLLAYAWHPLVTLEGAGGGHLDLLGTLLVVSTAYALLVGRTMVASLSLAMAFGVKFLPIVLVPLLWGRVRIRDLFVAVAAIVAFYTPFTSWPFSISFGSLGTYIEQWRFNGPFFLWLEPLLSTVGALVFAILIGLGVAIFARSRLPVDAPEAWAWPMATTLFLMPVVYPWYLVWLTPFLVSRATLPLIVWTHMSLLTYIVWTSQLQGSGWVLPGWVEPLEYGLVAIVGLAIWFMRHLSGATLDR